jgi:hypothetical protein
MALLALLISSLWSPAIERGATSARRPATSALDVDEAYRRLPLGFVANAGQIDRRVRFLAQASGATFWFTRREAVFALPAKGRRVLLHLRFRNADPRLRVVGERRQPGIANFLNGADAAKSHSGVPVYGAIVYRDLWPGIDLAFRGDGAKLKYEFRLAPGADPSRIQLAYRGAHGLSVDKTGTLLIPTGRGVLRDQPPTSYQQIGGRRIFISSRFAVGGRSATTYSFKVGDADSQRPLVIDPGLLYSTYIGGGGHEEPRPIAVDGNGRAYVAGRTSSIDFPTTPGAPDRTLNGPFDAYVAMLNPNGSALLYSTYLGGSGDEEARGIAVNHGRVYVTGRTDSTDFPTTAGAFDTTANGLRDVFVSKLDVQGGVVYSTYLGGSGDDEGFGIALDAANRAYVTGSAGAGGTPFPTTPGAFDTTPGGQDVFVTKLDQAGSRPVYSTLVGGSGQDQARSIAVDPDGNAYITGGAGPGTTPFPTTSGALDVTPNGGADVFVTKLDATGSSLGYSTLLGGGGGDLGRGIAVDGDRRAYITGRTDSANFPATPGAFDETYNGGEDGFVTKLKATGDSFAYSTFLGGTGNDDGVGIAVDDRAQPYVSGRTDSGDFPTTPGAFDQTYNGTFDAFVTSLHSTGALAYSTYLGAHGGDLGRGIALDPAHNVYVATQTGSTDFPVSPGAFDTTHNGAQDISVTKMSLQPTIG